MSRCFEQLDCRMVQMSCVLADFGCTRCAELDTSSQDLHVLPRLRHHSSYGTRLHICAIPPQMPPSPAHLPCTHNPDDFTDIVGSEAGVSSNLVEFLFGIRPHGSQVCRHLTLYATLDETHWQPLLRPHKQRIGQPRGWRRAVLRFCPLLYSPYSTKCLCRRRAHCGTSHSHDCVTVAACHMMIIMS